MMRDIIGFGKFITRYSVIGFGTEPGGDTYYMVRSNDKDIADELLTASDIKFLLALSFPLYDRDKKLIKLSEDGDVVGNIQDLTEYVFGSELQDSADSTADYTDDLESDSGDGVLDDDLGSSSSDSEDGSDDYEEMYDYSDTDMSDDTASDDIDEPIDYDDLYDYEDEQEEVPVVQRLYAHLNDEQIKVLRRYYLWYSQRLFADAQKDPTLGIKNVKLMAKKKEQLDNLRGSDRIWYYAGFVSFPKFGSMFCTLGHPLKYLHLAWDVSKCDIETAFFGENYNEDFEKVVYSDNCIRFGIKCMADFFEVDKECMYALNKAQSESLKDMEIILKYYEDGIVDNVIKTFNNLDDFMTRVKLHDTKCALIDKEPLMPLALSNLYAQFREVGLPPTKTMIQLIRDNLVGWDSHKFTGRLMEPKSKIFYTLDVLFGRGVSTLFDADVSFVDVNYRLSMMTDHFSSFVRYYLYALLTYKLCGVYEYDAVNNKDEGGGSKTVRYQLGMLYKGIGVLHDIEYTYNYAKMMVDILQGLRKFKSIIDTKKLTVLTHSGVSLSEGVFTDWYDSLEFIGGHKEFEEFCSSVGKLLILSNPAKSLRRFTGYVKQVDVTGIKDFVDRGTVLFYDKVEYFQSEFSKFSEEKLKVRLEELEKREKEKEEQCTDSDRVTESEDVVESKSSTVDGVGNTLSAVDMVTYLKGKDLSAYRGSHSFHLSVLDTCIKSGNEPSYKQGKYIRQLYSAYIGGDSSDTVQSDRVKLSTRPDLLDAINYKLEHTEGLDEKTISILKSIKRYGTISERQMKYAEKALEMYEEELK